MKKYIVLLSMIAIGVALMIGGCQKNGPGPGNPSANKAAADEQMSSDMQAFYDSLSPEGQKQFMQLDDEHKQNAMDMVKGKGSNGSAVKNPNDAVSQQLNKQLSSQK